MQVGLEAILNTAPIIPVLVITELEDAIPLARALVNSGLSVLEVTLRSPIALEAIHMIKSEVENVVIGAGTVLTPHQLKLSAQAGCQFAVAPGSSPKLLKAVQDHEFAFLPGTSTPSEAMRLFEQGYYLQKFFPAEACGGVSYLSALASPLPQIKFCPTGGISAQTAPSYLQLANVISVGGSWMIPQKSLQTKDWPHIERLAKEASSLQTNKKIL